MNRRRGPWLATAGAVAVLATMVTMVGIADGADRTTRVTACADKKSGALRLSRPACTTSEKRLRWATRGPVGAVGPVGPPGPPGPAGALTTTPIDVRYDATRSTPHQLTAVGGVLLHLECGSTRIGAQKADLGVFADQVHGVSTQTLSTGSSRTYAVNGTVSADLDGPSVGGSVTHGFENFQATVTVGGVVSQVTMYVARDGRAGRPACEFVGSVVELGPVTVSPS